MTRLVLLAATCGLLLGLSAVGDDPPKKLTPEERQELELKARDLTIASLKAREEGKFPDAVKAAQQALEIALRLYPKNEFPDGHLNLASSLNNLASMYKAQGKLAEAEPLYKDALDMRRRLFKGDHLQVAQSLNRLAGLYQEQGKLAEAEPYFKDALAMYRRLIKGDHIDVAMILDDLAGVLHGQSKLAEAEPVYKDALAMYKALFKGNHPDVARTLQNLAIAYEGLGKLGEAETLYADALAMRRRLHPGDHADVALSLYHLATLYSLQGRLTEAEPFHRDALAMRKRLFPDGDLAVVQSMNALVGQFRTYGRLTDAEVQAKEALALCRRLFKGDQADTADVLMALAALYADQGRMTEAETHCKESLEMRKRLFQGHHRSIASSLNNLGALYLHQQKPVDAEQCYRDALALYRRLFKGDHTDIAMCVFNLGTACMKQEKLADAESLYKDALAMNKRLFEGAHPSVAECLHALATVSVGRGNPNDAMTHSTAALAMRKRLFKGDHPDVAASMSMLAVLYGLQGKAAEAETLDRETLAMQSRLLAAYARQRSEGEAITYSASQPPTLHAYLAVARLRWMSSAGSYDPATTYPNVWASRGTIARVFEQRQLQARAAADPATAKMLGEITDARRRRAELLLAPTADDPGTQTKREHDLKSYDATITRLNATLPSVLPALTRIDKLVASTPADIQKALPADAAFVDYLRYTSLEGDERKPAGQNLKQVPRYLAFMVTRGKIAWVDLDTAANIEPAIASWREAITAGKEIPAAVPAKVRELVWQKVRKELPAGIKTVYIAPDEALCRVPWAAIPGDNPGTILLEDVAVATIPHGAFLLDKLWEQDKRPNPPSGALVVGGVNYDAATTGGPTTPALPATAGTATAWSALPGALAEATGIETVAKNKQLAVTAFKGEKATPAAVLAALPKARYAHLATHGFFADPSFRSAFQLDPKDFAASIQGERIGRAALSPLVMTGLVFAGANNPKTPGRGIVTGEALVDLDLSGLELAVLSACETGLGDVAGGEGTFSLQRAFHLAGTRDVVASLWKVPDTPTAALMGEFYRNLWEKNLSPLESLRQAQLFIYRNPDKIKELAAGFRTRAGFKELKGDETEIKLTADGKAHPRLWAAFSLSGPGR